MRLRTRFFLHFAFLSLALTTVAGSIAFLGLKWVLHTNAVRQAEELPKILHGYTFTDRIRAEAERLTGYSITVINDPKNADPRMVVGQVGSTWIAIDPQTSYQVQAERLVLIASGLSLFAGLFAALIGSRILAQGLARPIEHLAASARRIATGDLEHPIPQVGSGEIGTLASELESMRSQHRQMDLDMQRAERLTTLGLFTATVAHEVRNPLTAVKLSLQILQKNPGRDPSATLAMVQDEIERMDLILDEVLSYARDAKGGMRVEPVPCDLAPLAREVLRLLERQAQHAQVTMQVEGESRVRADPLRIRQILMNLIRNAIQVQHGGGTVLVRLRPDGLEVIDQGPGIPPERLEHLFEAFSSDRVEGTGLGLHLAQAIAKAHGGQLRYIPGTPSGAIFRLEGLTPC